jgi:hypothetical protein
VEAAARAIVNIARTEANAVTLVKAGVIAPLVVLLAGDAGGHSIVHSSSSSGGYGAGGAGAGKGVSGVASVGTGGGGGSSLLKRRKEAQMRFDSLGCSGAGADASVSASSAAAAYRERPIVITPRCKEHISRALALLAYNAVHSLSTAKAGGIPALTLLMITGTTEAAENATAVLYQMSYVTDLQAPIANSPGAIDALVHLVVSGSSVARINACRTLGLVATHPENQAAIVAAGAISAIGTMTLVIPATMRLFVVQSRASCPYRRK